MATNVGGVEYKVELDQKRVAKNLQRVGVQITKWGNRIGNVVSGLIGFSMFANAKRGWMDLQSSLRQVSALTQGKTNIKELTKLANKMATTFGEDASKSVNAFYQAISAGFSDDASRKLVKISNELSAASTGAGQMLDSVGAINALTTVLNAFSLSAGHAREVSDLLTNSVNFGKTTINELAGSISTVAPIAAAFGVGIEDVLVNISALTQAGVDTATATVGLRQMMNELANGSTEAGQALKQNLGVSFAEAISKGMTLTQILRDGLLPSVNGNAKEFINLFGNIRASTAAITLANNNFKLATNIQNKFKKSLDATKNGADAFKDTAITKFKSGLEVIKTTLVSAIDLVGGLGNALTILMGVFAAFKVANLVSKIATAVSAFASLAVAKTAAQSGVGAIGTVPAVVGAIGAGLAAVAAIGGTVAAGVLFNRSSGSSGTTTGGGGNASGTQVVNKISFNVDTQTGDVAMNGNNISNNQGNVGRGGS